MSKDKDSLLMGVLMALFIVLGMAVAIRIALAQGDWSCFFSADIPLCLAVKER